MLLLGLMHAESVAVNPNGDLALLDRYGSLFEAKYSSKAVADSNSSSSSWTLQLEPVVRLGAGRPLGYHLDREGNLIVCDSLKVSLGPLLQSQDNGGGTLIA